MVSDRVRGAGDGRCPWLSVRRWNVCGNAHVRASSEHSCTGTGLGYGVVVIPATAGSGKGYGLGYGYKHGHGFGYYYGCQ